MRGLISFISIKVFVHVRKLLFLMVLGILLAPPVSAFDTTIEIGDSRIHTFIEDDAYKLSNGEITAWVRRAVGIVSDYYGGFPVEEAYVAVSGRSGKGVLNGIALGEAGAVVNLKLGLSSDLTDLGNDWVLVHELIHLAFPKVNRKHHWIEEGLSVYVESIARAQAGDISADDVWGNFIRGMPNGLPQTGDRGLDNTPTWGRTYWGGALFFLLADIEILRRSGGEKSLQDGLRAIVDHGYSILQQGEPRLLFGIADRAMGYPVLTNLYNDMSEKPVAVDLIQLWEDLGVSYSDGAIHYSDQAKLSRVRTLITQGPQ